MTTMRNIIKGALRQLNVTAANEEPTAEDVDISLSAMNSLIDSLSNDLLNIHTIKAKRYLLTPGQQDYTLGPEFDADGVATDVDFPIERPMRIEQSKLILFPSLVWPAPPVQVFNRYAAIPANNGYDGDVGVSGFLGVSAPYEMTDHQLSQTDPGFNPISAETGLKGAAFNSEYNFCYAGIGDVTDPVNLIGPANIGTTRGAARGGTQRVYFYIPLGADDTVFVVSQNFEGYALPYTIVVNVGTTAATGQRYQLSGTAADSGFSWSITRLADA